ncbi:MAG: AsmA family protein [Rhodospirillaceae bacterium]
MKKVVIGLVVLLVLAIGALLIGPSLIDWSKHTDRIAREVEKLTGRKVVIKGPVDVRILPSPRLAVAGIELANIRGAQTTQMASLQSLEVHVAAAPLLAGRVQVKTVHIVKPVIRLERLADGRVNWALPVSKDGDGKAPSKPAPASSGGGAGTSGPTIGIDNFTIEDGEIHYLDAQLGRQDAATDIDARIAAVSLQGPIESLGSFTVRDRRISYRVNIAEIIQARTVPLFAEMTVADGASFNVDGSVGNVPDKPRLKAKIKGGGPDLGALIRFLQGSGSAGLQLAKPFSLTGDIEADADGAELQLTNVRIDETDFAAAAELKAGARIEAGLSIRSGWVDADRWIQAMNAPPPAEETQAKTLGVAKSAAGANKSAPVKNPAVKPQLDAPFELPKDVAAAVSVQLDAVVFNGKPIQGVVMNAELANGELTLSQLTAQLPGDTDLDLFGVVGVKDGKPRFEGKLETRAKDLQPVIAWIAPGVSVPPGALKDFLFKTKMIVDGRYAQLPGLSVKAGGTTVMGGVTVALQARPSFGADFKINRLDVDQLLGSGKAASPVAGKAGDKKAAGQTAAAKTAVPAADVFAPLRVLSAFDANLKLKIANAVYGGQKVSDLSLEAVLQRGNLALSSFRVGNFAGVKLAASGKIGGLDGIPKAKNLKIALRSKDIGPAAQAFGVALPFPAKDIGAVDLDAIVNGSLFQPNLDVQAGAFGGDFAAKGDFPMLALAGKSIKLGVRARHKDLATLIRRAGVDYTPQGRIGGLDLQATVTGNKDQIRVEGLYGTVGGIKTDGVVSVVLNAPKQRVDARLALGPVTLDPFLPAKRGSFILPGGWQARGVPAAWLRDPPAGLLSPAAVSKRWDAKPIELSALNVVDAAVALTTPRLSHQGVTVDNLDVGAVIDQGSLRVDRLTGVLAGGQLTAKVSIVQDGGAAAQGSVNGLDLSRAGGLTGGTKASGRVNAAFDLTAKGLSQAQFVSSLAGTLSLTGKDLDTGSGVNAEGLVGLSGLTLALNQFAGAFGGPKKGAGLADVEAQFTMDRGIATPKVLRAVTNVGTANATGAIDLRAWTVNLKGGIQASPSLLSAAFSIATKKGINVPFAVTGDIDQPRIKIDTASLGAGGVPIPGLDRLMRKKGVGDVLQGILGGGQAQPAPSQTAPGGNEPPAQGSQPQPQQQPSRQKITPQNILKGILGGFGR